MKKQSAGSNTASNLLVALLSAGSLLFMLLAALALYHMSRWDTNDGQYLLRALDLKTGALEINRQTLDAFAGDQDAFANLRESRDSMERLVNELNNGVPEQQLPPSPPEVASQLQTMGSAWLDLREIADGILNGREAITSLAASAGIISGTLPRLETLSARLLDSMLQAGASSRQIALASELLVVLARLDRSLSGILVAGQTAEKAVDQFGNATQDFGRNLSVLLKGDPELGILALNDPSLVDQLGLVAELFGSVNDQAAGIVGTFPAALPALAGAGGEAIVKLRIAEAIQGKRIILLPVSEGGMNLKTTDINRLIETLGIKALSGGK